MRRKFGNHWVEYRDPIDLMECPSNMDIDSIKKANNKVDLQSN
jgi:hypothetical protein